MFKYIKDFFSYSPHDLNYILLPDIDEETTKKVDAKMSSRYVTLEKPSAKVEHDIIKSVEVISNYYNESLIDSYDVGMLHVYKVEMCEEGCLNLFLKTRGSVVSRVFIVDLDSVVCGINLVDKVDRIKILEWYDKIRGEF